MRHSWCFAPSSGCSGRLRPPGYGGHEPGLFAIGLYVRQAVGSDGSRQAAGARFDCPARRRSASSCKRALAYHSCRGVPVGRAHGDHPRPVCEDDSRFSAGRSARHGLWRFQAGRGASPCCRPVPPRGCCGTASVHPSPFMCWRLYGTGAGWSYPQGMATAKAFGRDLIFGSAPEKKRGPGRLK